MQSTVLEPVSAECYPGVVVDSDLKVWEQAASAVSNATQILAVICPSFQFIDKITLSMLFKTLVCRNFECGNLVWC